MRSTVQSLLYPTLTDRQRYRGINVKYTSNGVLTFKTSKNNSLTPEIAKLLSDKNNSKIPILEFQDGLLNIQNGACYRVKTRFHGLQAYSISSNGFPDWKPSHDMPDQDFRHFVTQAEYEDIYTTNRLLRAFQENSFDEFISKITWYNPTTTPGYELLKLGAPVGEFIKISKYDEAFMIDHNNGVYTEEDIENLRIGYNNRDTKAMNHPPGTIYRIDGHDYEVDENWRLHVPEGVICTPARVQIIKQT